MAAEETGLRGDGDTLKSQGFNWSSRKSKIMLQNDIMIILLITDIFVLKKNILM